MICDGEIGIHPPGALGVAFLVHTRAEVVIGRGGDGITELLKSAGELRLDDGGRQRMVSLRGRIFSNLLEAEALERVPEVIMVVCEPDQLRLFTADIARFLENLAGRGRLRTVDDARKHMPILLVLPNGILSELTLDTFEEQLGESRVMGRLPGVTDEMVAALLQRIVRGVSLQAGGRRGGGAETVYILERRGTLVFAGGGDAERDRIEAILTAHAYPFKHARGVPGTRIEFDKAMISIVLNVGGIIHMVRANGDLVDLRMGDLCKNPETADFVARVTRSVFDVGRAAGAYPPDANYDEIWAGHRATILAHADHVTSSVKSFRDALDRGLDSVKLFSNEEWLLTPLGRYAAKAGLAEHERLFKTLKQRVQEAMARAIRRRRAGSEGPDGRNENMRLAAQRDFSVELYDSGPDNMMLIGTMLDAEHLVKLELNIYLPDEQITRSRLEMIRSPFPVCREIEAAAERLVGLRIERGVTTEIAHRVGGRGGCSHVKELASNIIYFAAAHLARRRTGVEGDGYLHRLPEERFALTKELLRDSCLAYCQTTPQGLDERVGIRRLGEDHTNPLPLGELEPSIGAVLQDRAQRWGEKPYLRYRKPGPAAEFVTLTWGEFARRAHQIARHLMELGVRRGDRIGVISENRAEMFLSELAIVSIGAVSVPIFAGHTAPNIAFALDHSHPRLLIVSGEHQLEKIDRTRHASVERWYCMDFTPAAKSWGALGFAALLTDGGVAAEKLNERVASVVADDPAIVMYTSGTTGPPKGVQLSHRNILSQQKALALVWDVSGQDVVMNYLPWHHSFGGLFERFLTFYHGTELCLDDSRGRDIDRLIDNWRVYRPTIFCSVPRVHSLLVQRCREDPKIADLVFRGGLRFVFTAGAPLPSGVEAAYREQKVPVLEGWGLTETSPCVTVRTPGTPWRNGYVGFPIPGVTLRVESDQELLVKGPNVMLGYLNDEEANSRVLTEDGWFRTGDVGEYTRDGLRIFGRKDGAFKLTTGEKVHPQRVEMLIVNESPFISDVVVLGSGEDFAAAVIFPDFARLRRWAREQGMTGEPTASNPGVIKLIETELRRINPMIEVKFHRIRRAVVAEDSPSPARGEITPSGKLIRRAVVDNHRRLIDRLFSPVLAEGVIEVREMESVNLPVQAGVHAHAR
ncbi:MAG: AMP-binding protein [Phycisphaerae bacterium]